MKKVGIALLVVSIFSAFSGVANATSAGDVTVKRTMCIGQGMSIIRTFSRWVNVPDDVRGWLDILMVDKFNAVSGQWESAANDSQLDGIYRLNAPTDSCVPLQGDVPAESGGARFESGFSMIQMLGSFSDNPQRDSRRIDAAIRQAGMKPHAVRIMVVYLNSEGAEISSSQYKNQWNRFVVIPTNSNGRLDADRVSVNGIRGISLVSHVPHFLIVPKNQ